MSPVELTYGRRGRVSRSQIIQRRKCLALYKSFNILCIIQYPGTGKRANSRRGPLCLCFEYVHDIEILPLPLNVFISIVRKQPERRKSRSREIGEDVRAVSYMR
jgi:hypothetical protein